MFSYMYLYILSYYLVKTLTKLRFKSVFLLPQYKTINKPCYLLFTPSLAPISYPASPSFAPLPFAVDLSPRAPFPAPQIQSIPNEIESLSPLFGSL
jgi:hypothetical protein